MKNSNTIRFLWLLCLAVFVSGCTTTPIHFQAVNIESGKSSLKAHALQILKSYRSSSHSTDSSDSMQLTIHESIEEDYESVDASGKVNRFKINYTLFYRFGEQSMQNLNYEIVVDHNENNYLASRAKRQQALHELRESALRQMFFLINRQS